MNITLRNLVAGAIEIDTPPEIYVTISKMIDGGRHSAADIGHVISNNTALSAQLLEIANSVFYGFPSQIDTISRVITVIGTGGLRELILAASMFRCFEGLPNDLVKMEDFWRHSICCALAARSLATRRGALLAERFFVAGLLHDIGSLLVYCKAPQLSLDALLHAQLNKVPIHRAEWKIMGFDHAMVGAEIMRHWKLPEHLQQCTEFHHNPDRAQRFRSDAALVHIADVIAEFMEHGHLDNTSPPHTNFHAWQLAGIEDDVMESVISDVTQQFSCTLELFSPERGLTDR
jgi:putative nucleotidyltransferase with HDIG domain